MEELLSEFVNSLNVSPVHSAYAGLKCGSFVGCVWSGEMYWMSLNPEKEGDLPGKENLSYRGLQVSNREGGVLSGFEDFPKLNAEAFCEDGLPGGDIQEGCWDFKGGFA